MVFSRVTAAGRTPATARRWLFAAALMTLAGCTSTGGTIFAGPTGSPVPIPSTANAPPQTVTLTTVGLPNNHDVSVTAGGSDVTITVAPGQGFFLYADAVDSEGLQSVQILGGTDLWTCVNPATNEGQQYSVTFGAPAAQNTDTSTNPTEGYPERYVTYGMTYQSCPAGYPDLQSAIADFNAQGVNYSGLTSTTATLTIDY